MRHGSLSHLSPEDRDLYLALYRERNNVDRSELAAVRHARRAAHTAAVATSPLACSYATPATRTTRGSTAA